MSLLTTLARIKEYAGIDSAVTTYDTKLTNLGNSASRAIEKYCGVFFLANDYTEVGSGNGSFIYEVLNSPINSISRVSTNRTTVLTVSNTTTTNQWATVAVSSTGLTLSRTASAE